MRWLYCWNLSGDCTLSAILRIFYSIQRIICAPFKISKILLISIIRFIRFNSLILLSCCEWTDTLSLSVSFYIFISLNYWWHLAIKVPFMALKLPLIFWYICRVVFRVIIIKGCFSSYPTLLLNLCCSVCPDCLFSNLLSFFRVNLSVNWISLADVVFVFLYGREPFLVFLTRGSGPMLFEFSSHDLLLVNYDCGCGTMSGSLLIICKSIQTPLCFIEFALHWIPILSCGLVVTKLKSRSVRVIHSDWWGSVGVQLLQGTLLRKTLG